MKTTADRTSSYSPDQTVHLILSLNPSVASCRLLSRPAESHTSTSMITGFFTALRLHKLIAPKALTFSLLGKLRISLSWIFLSFWPQLKCHFPERPWKGAHLPDPELLVSPLCSVPGEGDIAASKTHPCPQRPMNSTEILVTPHTK